MIFSLRFSRYRSCFVSYFHAIIIDLNNHTLKALFKFLLIIILVYTNLKGLTTIVVIVEAINADFIVPIVLVFLTSKKFLQYSYAIKYVQLLIKLPTISADKPL